MLTKYFSTILSLLAAGGAIASGSNNGVPRSLEDDLAGMSMPTSPTPSDLEYMVDGLNRAGLDITPSEGKDAVERAGRDDVNAELAGGFGRSRTYNCSGRYPCRNACWNCFMLLDAIEWVKGPRFYETNKLECNPLLELFCATQSIVLPSTYNVPMENLEDKGNYLQDVFPEGHPKHEVGDKIEDLTDEYFYYLRRLREGDIRTISEKVPLDERMELIKKMEFRGAKADATFVEKHNLISKDASDALVKLMDISLEAHIDSGEDTPVGTSKDDNEVWTGQGMNAGMDFHQKLYADELVALIGKVEAQKIVNFFHDNLGGLAIDTMYLARHGVPKDGELYESPWHIDDYATVEIVLNDDFDGGATLHLNEEGVHKSEPRQGSAIAHFADIIHGTQPNENAPKYMLILKHHFNSPEKEGVVKLSKEMVDALPVRI